MPQRIMVLQEADPNHPGFIRFYYAQIRVEIGSHKHNWTWNQVNHAGALVGTPTSGFDDEKDAYDDALSKLGGTGWLNPAFLV